MKKPLQFLLLTFSFLVLCALFVFVYFTGEHHHDTDSHENETFPEILGSMDMWANMRSYPNNSFIATGYFEGFQRAKQMELKDRMPSAFSRTQASNWIPLAPMNFAGRILCLGFHPTNANIMWAGSASGGLWKTTNGGTGGAGGINWTQVQTGYPVLSVSAIAINPTNANEMYIGTGEVYNSDGNGFAGQNVRTYRGSYGIGILKSIDGGTTWTSSLNFTNSANKGVEEIIVDPSNPNNLFAATTDGVYRSTDAGSSWALIHNVPMAMDICINPSNADTLYVACGNFGSAGSGIYKSTDARSGTPTFTQLSGGLPSSINGKIAMGMCPDNPNLIFAAVGKIPGDLNGTQAVTFGLFVTHDAGNTWAPAAGQPQLGGKNYIQNQGWYSHDVIVSKKSVHSVYVSEIDLLSGDTLATGWSKRSDWSKWNLNKTIVGTTSEGTATNYVHADIHHLYYSPFDPSYMTIFLVTDGGIFKSVGGGFFTALNGGLMTAQIYHKMGMSATNSNLMICGLQDNATMWYQGITGCKRVTGGDGFYSIIDPTNDSVCFGTYAYMAYGKSSTGIAPLMSLGGFSNPIDVNTGLPQENACFVAPLVMAPSDHNRIYGGTINFKRSDNNGSTIANYGTTNPVVNAQAPIICIAVSKTNADSVYIATCPGGGANPGMYLSSDGGNNWTNITGSLPNRYFSSIAVDPTNSRRVAVTVSGFGTSHVYLTSDAGTTWNDISGVGGTGLVDVPANIAMFDPTTPTTLYVGNDIGVFLAQNISDGSTPPIWYAYNSGLTDATMVMDLQVAPNGKLRMGTYGKGLWENNMVTGSLPVLFESFRAWNTNQGNNLQWVVATQQQVSRYEVEYSTDGASFSVVGSVAARAGTTHLTYNFLHKINNEKTAYYRIKVIDLNGDVSYSTVEQIKADHAILTLVAAPNPTSGIFNVQIPKDINGVYALKLFDQLGRLVYAKKFQSQNSSHEQTINISRMQAGTYKLVCEYSFGRYVTSIIKN